MKIVKIIGGLGNQMFQYALAYKLKLLYPNEKILLDLTHFNGYAWHPYELKRVFGVSIPTASFFELLKLTLPISSSTSHTLFRKYVGIILGKIFNYSKYEYNDTLQGLDKNVFKKHGDCYFNGYWANQGYFEDIRPQILKIFTFRLPLSDDKQQLKLKIEESNSVSIHVRRGNYLLFDEFKNICERPYYSKAIAYIKEHVKNPHFFIFSNDMQWCKENLADLMETYTFADNNDPKNNYVDMQLMSCCKHNIIAHSTFSWWAAWLNQNIEKIVVAPLKWNNNDTLTGTDRIQLEDWVLMDNSDE